MRQSKMPMPAGPYGHFEPFFAGAQGLFHAALRALRQWRPP
jgi:hypothetical protein